MLDKNVKIESVELHSDRHGDYITIQFDKSGESVTEKFRHSWLLSAIEEYKEKYIKILEMPARVMQTTEIL